MGLFSASSVDKQRLLLDLLENRPDRVSTRGLGAFSVSHSIFTAYIKLHTQQELGQGGPLGQQTSEEGKNSARTTL